MSRIWAFDARSPYLNDQGLLPDGTYMCLDGKARTGDWEKAKRLLRFCAPSESRVRESPVPTRSQAESECVRENPDDLNWLTEWVVAARTGQLEKTSKGK